MVGLDIGKRKHHAFFGNANGQTILKGLIVENSAEGFRHLLSQGRFYMQRDGFSRVVFELMVEMLESVQPQLLRVEHAIQKLAESFEEYGYLKSIPRFGQSRASGRAPSLALSAWRCRIIVTIK